MITDKMKNKVATYIKDTLIDSAKIGQGGNSTNPVLNDLDVPLSVIPTINKAVAGTSNVFETKITVSGSSITGKVIREVGLFHDVDNDDTTNPDAVGDVDGDGTGDDMIQRINFEGIGPFASNEDLEIFIIMEVE